MYSSYFCNYAKIIAQRLLILNVGRVIEFHICFRSMATTCEKENQYLKYNNIDIGLIILS
jgi:hypothetical protein